MDKLTVCIHCEREFNPKKSIHRRGKINECGWCAKDIPKSLGIIVVNGKTDYHTEVMENPSKNQAKFIRSQMKCGPSQCHSALGLSTNGANTPKDKLDAVQSKLYEEEEV